MFCENTHVRKEEVYGVYRNVNSFLLKDFEDEFTLEEELIKKDDFNKCLNQIEEDVKNAIQTIKSLAVDEGIGELSVLLEKLY